MKFITCAQRHRTDESTSASQQKRRGPTLAQSQGQSHVVNKIELSLKTSLDLTMLMTHRPNNGTTLRTSDVLCTTDGSNMNNLPIILLTHFFRNIVENVLVLAQGVFINSIVLLVIWVGRQILVIPS